MKTLIASLVLMTLALTACDQGGGGSSGSSTALDAIPNLQSPVASPAAPIASPAAPIVCAPFDGTHWVIQGSPTLTAMSQDQSGHAPYVAEFDMSTASPSFTENQYIGPGTLSCTRTISSGQAYTSDSLLYPVVQGSCGAVSVWLFFDTSQCNKLVVTVMYGVPTGQNGVYETATYVPTN